MELSFQVIATRKVKKRRLSSHGVTNNNNNNNNNDSNSHPAKEESNISFPSNLPPPEPPAPDDIKEPPEKIAKMESSFDGDGELRNSHHERRVSYGVKRELNHLTPLSPEDHHGRPPTPPETPESHQHIMVPTKCENIDDGSEISGSSGITLDPNLITPSEDTFDDEDDEHNIGDQDSEAPLEVDTSHETEPELEIELDHEDDDSRRQSECQNEVFAEQEEKYESISQDENSEETIEENIHTQESEIEESEDVKPPRRIRRNVVVQAGQDGSCAFSDSDNEATDASGALDLSDHAQRVREARAREGGDISRVQGTQTILSVTQSKTPKKKNKLIQQQNLGASNWQQGSAATQAAAFALLQLALVQAKAQEAKKSPNPVNYSKAKEASDSLSIIHDSGHSLTISPVNGNAHATKAETVKFAGNKSPKSSSQKNGAQNSGDERAVTNTLTISRAGKDGTLKSKLNKSPVHRTSTTSIKHSSSSPPHKSPNSRRSKSIEKDTMERTGDPIFKITNQKLSECFRQQMSNRLKNMQNSSSKTCGKTSLNADNSSANKSSVLDNTPPVKSPSTKDNKSTTSSSEPSHGSLGKSSQNQASSNSSSDESKIKTQIKISKSMAHSVNGSEEVSKNIPHKPVLVTSNSSSTSQKAITITTTKSQTPKAPSQKPSLTKIQSPTNQKAPISIIRESALTSPTQKPKPSDNQKTPVLAANLKSSPISIKPLSTSSQKTAGQISTKASAGQVVSKSCHGVTISKSVSTSSLSKPASINSTHLSNGTSQKFVTTSSAPGTLHNSVNFRSKFQTTQDKTAKVSNGSTPSVNANSSVSKKPTTSKVTSSETKIQSNKISISSSLISKTPVTITPVPTSSTSASLIIPRSSISFTPIPSNKLKQTSKDGIPNLIRTNSLNGTSNSFNKSDLVSLKTAASSHGVTLTPIRTLMGSSSAASNAGFPTTQRSTLNNTARSIMGASSTVSAPSQQRFTHTSSMNSSLTSVRPTNSSVRHIPNPSLLHQQSESRLAAGLAGTKLNGVLSRLNSVSSNGGISKIESVSRSLYEKAAAAINTAAR